MAKAPGKVPGPECVVCRQQPQEGKPERDNWVGLRLGSNAVFTHTNKRGQDTGERSTMVTFPAGTGCYTFVHVGCLPENLRPVLAAQVAS